MLLFPHDAQRSVTYSGLNRSQSVEKPLKIDRPKMYEWGWPCVLGGHPGAVTVPEDVEEAGAEVPRPDDVDLS